MVETQLEMLSCLCLEKMDEAWWRLEACFMATCLLGKVTSIYYFRISWISGDLTWAIRKSWRPHAKHLAILKLWKNGGSSLGRVRWGKHGKLLHLVTYTLSQASWAQNGDRHTNVARLVNEQYMWAKWDPTMHASDCEMSPPVTSFDLYTLQTSLSKYPSFWPFHILTTHGTLFSRHHLKTSMKQAYHKNYDSTTKAAVNQRKPTFLKACWLVSASTGRCSHKPFLGRSSEVAKRFLFVRHPKLG